MTAQIFSLLVACSVIVSCSRKGTAYNDCIENESKEYVLCASNSNQKSKVIKVVERSSDEVVYERDLSNGGNAIWHSNSVIEVQVFSGYSDEISTYYYDIELKSIVKPNQINN